MKYYHKQKVGSACSPWHSNSAPCTTLFIIVFLENVLLINHIQNVLGQPKHCTNVTSTCNL